MLESEWPAFPSELLRAPPEEWEGPPTSDTWAPDPALVLPGRSSPGRDGDDGDDQDVEAATALLEALDGAIAGARGGQDRAKALATMQTFLAVRRARLVEDMIMLSLSLGEGDREDGNMPEPVEGRKSGGVDLNLAGGMHAAGASSDGGSLTSSSGPATASPSHRPSYPTLTELRRELSAARDRIPPAPSRAGGGDGCSRGSLPPSLAGEDSQHEPSVLIQGSTAEVELRAAGAGSSVDMFFRLWAERHTRLLVPLESTADGDGVGVGGSDPLGGDRGEQRGGGPRKDDREIQAARDVERDRLLVNGVLVVGSEGYAAVVGRVKRELGALAEPITGLDGHQLSSGSTRETPAEVPLRPPGQLENFAKLVLKAANRTESGGLSFDAIHRVTALCPNISEGSVLVVPDSTKAEPLGITITAEGFTETGDTPFGSLQRFPELRDGVDTFGVCARVEATLPGKWSQELLDSLSKLQAVTVYSLYSADMETVYLTLRATFRSSIRLPLSPFSSARCKAFADVGYRGEGGQVEIEVVQGPKTDGQGLV